MAKLKIYGTSRSRAARALWAARELGLDFEQVDINPRNGDHQTPEFLAVNPNGRVPAMDDDGVKLFESLAISLYLAKKYGSTDAAALYPTDAADEGRTLQWSIWAATELEGLLMTCMVERLFKPEAERNPAVAADAEERLQRPLKVLDGHLAARPWLVADHFTIADLNVASALAPVEMVGVDLSAYANVTKWLAACMGRPAAAA